MTETETDTPQPGEREGLERPTWLLDGISKRRNDRLYTLATPGNLRLLVDWIAQLEQEAAAAPDIAAIRIATLTRELSEARALCGRQSVRLTEIDEEYADTFNENVRLRDAAQATLDHFHERVPLEEGEAAHICAQCGADWPKHERACVIGRLQDALAPAQEVRS